MRQGFTIIEIIITIAITGVLLGLGTAAVKSIQPSVLLGDATRQLTSDIRLAQEKALSTQKKYAVIFTMPLMYQVVVTDPTTSTVKSVTLTNGVTISSVTGFINNTVIYNAVGEPSQSGSVVLSKDTKQNSIDIRPSGYVRIQKQ